MKTKLIASLFLLSVFAQGCVVVSDDGETITIYNESSYIIEDLYVTEVNTFDWGPDLLGSAGLFPGENITISVACYVYDIKVIDETGLECVVPDIDVCFGEDAGWVIDDLALHDCAFGVKPAEKAAKHGHEATDASK